MPFIPDQDQIKLILAHQYLANRDNKDNSNKILGEEEEKAFKEIHAKLEKGLNYNNIFESYIKEKSFNIDSVKDFKLGF